jgi:hypothetical protein
MIASLSWLMGDDPALDVASRFRLGLRNFWFFIFHIPALSSKRLPACAGIEEVQIEFGFNIAIAKYFVNSICYIFSVKQ